MPMKKIIYAIVTAALIVSGVLLINIFNRLEQHNIQMEVSHNQALLNEIATVIEERFQRSQSDASFISSYLDQNLMDLSAVNREETVEQLLKKVLPWLHQANDIYYKILYLDKDGYERISVYANGLHDSGPYPDRSAMGYFKGLKTHDVSNIPHVFVDRSNLYISTPLLDQSKRFYGAIVFVLNRDIFLEEIFSFAEEPKNIALVEKDGTYILRPGALKGKNFQDDFSQELYIKIMSGHSPLEDRERGSLLTQAQIKLDEENWVLIIASQIDEITAHTAGIRRELFVVLLMGFCLIGTVVVFWSKSYQKTLAAEQLRLQRDNLENINTQLVNKQAELEEQAAIVEELNAQLEDETVNMQKQKDTLRAIADSVEEGIAMISTEGEVVFVNQKWSEMFGACFLDGIHIDADKFISDTLANVKSGQEMLLQLKQLCKNFTDDYLGEIEQLKPQSRYIKLYSVPCLTARNSKILGRIFVCRDISRDKEVDRLKSELISTVSHELRTPMSSIVGFSELLLTRNLSPERSKDYIEIIFKESRRLTKLINDFLDIQRMESGRQEFNKQMEVFGNIVQEAMGLFNDTNNQHTITYHDYAGLPHKIYCDRDKIVQLISNLLSNAIKYSPNGGDVEVHAGVEGDVVKVAVKDQGLGIPDEAKDKLFTKFYRVDNDDRRKIGGTGLGLAVCREIVMAHGGQIWAESEFGSGSTFYFTIPLDSDAKAGNFSVRDQENMIDGNSVLIVEDDDSLVKLIIDVLEADGLATCTTDSGEGAIKLLDTLSFKAIILDIGLSGKMNGWDVLEVITENPNYANTPVIISSIYENKNHSMSGRASDFLVKPFEPEHLLKAVHKVLEKEFQCEKTVRGDDLVDSRVMDTLLKKGIRVKAIHRSGDVIIIKLDGDK